MRIERNMHYIDQAIRVILGIALVYYGFFDRSLVSDPLFGTLLGIFGVINLISAGMAMCPVYMLAGISTYKDSKSNPQD